MTLSHSATRNADLRLKDLEAVAEKSGEKLFAGQIRVLRLAVEAWSLQAQGEPGSAVERMLEAAELEVSTAKHPVTPAATLPAEELLGQLQMELGNAANARLAFERSLQLYPGRFNSLLGAARAARALGDHQAAAKYYRELLSISADGSTRDGLREAGEFISTD